MCFWYHGLMSGTSNLETVTKNLRKKKTKGKETVTWFLWHEMKQREKNMSVVPAANINFGVRFCFWFPNEYKLVQQSIVQV